MVDVATLERWLSEGVAAGATHMTIVGDTFPYDVVEYPHYRVPGQILEPLQVFDERGATFDLRTRTPWPFAAGPCGCEHVPCVCPVPEFV